MPDLRANLEVDQGALQDLADDAGDTAAALVGERLEGRAKPVGILAQVDDEKVPLRSIGGRPASAIGAAVAQLAGKSFILHGVPASSLHYNFSGDTASRS
jgi:hypothetical protein